MKNTRLDRESLESLSKLESSIWLNCKGIRIYFAQREKVKKLTFCNKFKSTFLSLYTDM